MAEQKAREDDRQHGRHAVIFAPFARDAELLDGMLDSHGIATCVCSSFHSLLAALDKNALCVLVTEEALALCDTRLLLESINDQPDWSDLPFIGLIGSAGTMQEGSRLISLSQIGNITLLERPVSTEALMMLVRTAVRSRMLQYQIREQFEELARYSRELEQRVDARTAALGKEVEERKRIEAALQESRRLEALGRLTGGIAHDFNNMLQVVTGSAELINAIAGSSDPRLARPIDSIRRAARNGAKLTQQLLAYARHQPLQSTSVDLAGHVQSLSDLLRHSLGRTVALDFEVSPELWPVKADLSQLDAAILNMVFNARDALPEGGSVTLSLQNATLPDPRFPEVAQLSGQYVGICLADAGCGISEADAARAFEPFFTTKALGKGTGLGLSQVQGFAVQSGGEAFIRALDQGTLVGFFLPRSHEQDAIADLPKDDDAPLTFAGKRVLCVEDHYEVMAVACAILEQLQASVTPAASADEACHIDLTGIDVVFSDVMMPGTMDGVDLAQHIRSQRPAMPIVLASGYVMDPGRLAELDVTFVQKPYSADDVQQAISREMAIRSKLVPRQAAQ